MENNTQNIKIMNSKMHPQDIVILLKMICVAEKQLSISEMSDTLQISISEISKAMSRNVIAGLVSTDKKHVNRLALREFLIHGLKYVFPAQPGGNTRGVLTAYSAPPINQFIVNGKEQLVWKYYKGTHRGNSITPLYPSVPKIIENQQDLYELLAIVDTLRVGKSREIELAIAELDKRLNNYGE